MQIRNKFNFYDVKNFTLLSSDIYFDFNKELFGND